MPYPRELPERPYKFNYGFLRKSYAAMISVGVGALCVAHAFGRVENKLPPQDPRDPRVILRKAENPVQIDDMPGPLRWGSARATNRLVEQRKELELTPMIREEMSKAESLEKGEHKLFVYTKAPKLNNKEEGKD